MNYTNNNSNNEHNNAWNQLVECIRQKHFHGGQFLLKLCSVTPHDLLTKRILIHDDNIRSSRRNSGGDGGEQRQRILIVARNDNLHVDQHRDDKRTKESNHNDVNDGPKCHILHFACKCRIPLEALRLLLHHCSKATDNSSSWNGNNHLHQFVNEQDDLGWTSLHYAILYGCSEDTIIKLIDAGGRPGNDKAVVAGTTPSAVTIPNNVGWTPLHLACRHGTTTKIIKAMLHVDSQVGALRSTTSTSSSSDKNSPPPNNAIHILWNAMMNRSKKHQTFLRSILQFSYGGPPPPPPTTTTTCITGELLLQRMKEDYPQLYEMWDQMICLIMSTSTRTGTTASSSMSTTMLHVAIPLILQQQLPVEVLQMATVMYPHFLYERDCHHHGRIPLHLILSTTSTSSTRTTGNNLNSCCRQVDGTLDIILQLFLSYAPQTARIMDPLTKRYPLHMAIDLGLSWRGRHQRQEHLTDANKRFAIMLWRDVLETRRQQQQQQQHRAAAVANNRVEAEVDSENGGSGSLQWLIEAAPEMLHEIDTPTQLLPAFLSASIEQSSFETTFRLLQHCPSQVIIV